MKLENVFVSEKLFNTPAGAAYKVRRVIRDTHLAPNALELMQTNWTPTVTWTGIRLQLEAPPAMHFRPLEGWDVRFLIYIPVSTKARGLPTRLKVFECNKTPPERSPAQNMHEYSFVMQEDAVLL